MSSSSGGQLSRQTTGLVDSLQGKTRALRIGDVARLLNVSERFVYKLVAEKCIPHFRIGGSIRFDPVITANWLSQKMNPSSVELRGEFRRRA
jgi:excisionase family DNA binding protein